MKHWTTKGRSPSWWNSEFQPRSLCNFGGGSDSDSDGGGPAASDDSGDFFGDSFSNADFFGTSGPGPESSNVSNADFFGAGGPDFSADTSGQNFSADTSGQNFSSDIGGQDFTGSDVSGQGFAAGALDNFTDYGPAGMAPTGGVDFTGGGQAFGPVASGPGYYGTDVSSQYGPATLGGPATATMSPDDLTAFHAPGFQVPGDPFGAPNVSSNPFGSPMSAEALDAQARGEQGRGWIGGPTNVQPGEEFIGGRGERSDVNPNFFGPASVGPQFTDSRGFDLGSIFGPNQAQAAGITDRGAMDVQNMANAFQDVAGKTTNDPALMEALNNIAANIQAQQEQAQQAQQAQQSILGPSMTGFEQATPGAQHGFTGVSPAQAAAGGPFVAGGPFHSDEPQAPPAYDPSGRANPEDLPHGQIGPGFELSNPNVTPGQQNFTAGKTGDVVDDFASRFGELTPAREQDQPVTFDSRWGDMPSTRGPEDMPSTRGPEDVIETIARSGPEITTGLIGPESRGVGREAAPLGGLLDMIGPESRGVGREAAPLGLQFGSPFGQQTGGRGSTQSGGRGGSQSGGRAATSPFGGFGPPASGRTSDPGYYLTGGRGIAPGAKGAEYGGIYGPGVATGRAGTGTFGVDSRSGAFGYFDPATGIYYGGGRR